MARQEARGKSEEGLGDFTFLYTVWFYCVHLLSCSTLLLTAIISIQSADLTKLTAG